MPREQTSRFRHILCLLCSTLLGVSLAALLLWPEARSGFLQLLNRLFEASEAVNSYVYDRFPVAESVSVLPAICLLGLIAASLLTLCAFTRSFWLPLLTAIGLSGVQAYFGLSLPAAANIGLYSLLGAIIVWKKAGIRAALSLLGCILVISLVVSAWLPGTNAAIETASEQVRDLLSYSAEQSFSGSNELPQPRMETRRENRRDLAEGAGSAVSAQDYHLVTVDEQQIARPHWIDYLRIALLCLLIPVALALPFLPFLWINRQNRKTAEKYACLDEADHSVSIDGMFSLVIEYLDACGIGQPSALHIHRMDSLDERLPQSYRELYLQCAAIWQEAYYSDHPAGEAARETVLHLLEETEDLLYEKADWKTQLRLKYICCLHG